jgi:hypothetical protein
MWPWIIVIGSILTLVFGCGFCVLVGLLGTRIKPTPPQEINVEIGKDYPIGKGFVRVTSVKKESPTATSPGGFLVVAAKIFLVIRFEVGNPDPTTSLSYTGWASHAVLTDDFHNEYAQCENLETELGFTAKLRGQVDGTIGIHSDRPAHDMLVFSVPVPAARQLHLRVPASSVGGRGDVILHIPYP